MKILKSLYKRQKQICFPCQQSERLLTTGLKWSLAHYQHQQMITSFVISLTTRWMKLRSVSPFSEAFKWFFFFLFFFLSFSTSILVPKATGYQIVSTKYNFFTCSFVGLEWSFVFPFGHFFLLIKLPVNRFVFIAMVHIISYTERKFKLICTYCMLNGWLGPSSVQWST